MDVRGAILLFVLIHTMEARLLGVYNIDHDTITVSGISAGASMATQMHVAYSSIFKAVGMIAGSPYYCAENGLMQALRCMDSPMQVNVPHLISETEGWVSNGRIDPTWNLMGSKVYIFQGTLDTTVVPGIGPRVLEYYQHYVNNADIQYVDYIGATHGFPTMDTGFPCAIEDPEFINRCEYDSAYHMLQQAYGDIVQPIGHVPLNGELYLFDQSEFFEISLPIQSSFDSEGYVYVPSGCMHPHLNPGKVCRLHLVFHGCLQGRHRIGDSFVTKTGYNEVAELNDIIMLYPQAVPGMGVNPNGCFDWWGYLNMTYNWRGGNQPLAVIRMVRKMADMPLAPGHPE